MERKPMEDQFKFSLFCFDAGPYESLISLSITKLNKACLFITRLLNMFIALRVKCSDKLFLIYEKFPNDSSNPSSNILSNSTPQEIGRCLFIPFYFPSLLFFIEHSTLVNHHLKLAFYNKKRSFIDI